MDEAHKKAASTRRKNEEYQRKRWQEQQKETEIIRKSLLRVLERDDATPAEILKAVRLMRQ